MCCYETGILLRYVFLYYGCFLKGKDIDLAISFLFLPEILRKIMHLSAVIPGNHLSVCNHSRIIAPGFHLGADIFWRSCRLLLKDGRNLFCMVDKITTLETVLKSKLDFIKPILDTCEKDKKDKSE